MLQKSQIEQFYRDVESVRDIKKLNSVIAKATGYSSGNVSEYLNRKKEPSESFLNSFYEWFKNVPRESTAADKSIRKPKIELNENTDGITFIPISAQGGYSKRFLDPIFTSSLQKLYIPGFPYRGDQYRIWEVEGNSMEPELKEGLYILTEKIEDWKNAREGNAYVFVTIDTPLVKWLKSKGKIEWTLGNDNELYPDIPVSVTELKELWLVKKKMEWEGVAPKRFKPKV